MSAADIRQALAEIRQLLDQGQEDSAMAELKKILATDPQHKAALALMRQIRDDPVSLYGRESFAYRVMPGDTLASIAQRHLNDMDQFYGLARYNGIKVPRQLAAGSTIRVPGKRPAGAAAGTAAPPAPSPAPVLPAPAPARPAPSVPPPAAPQVRAAPPPVPASAAAPGGDAALTPRSTSGVDPKAEIARCSRAARAAMARQDICAAIQAWECVLAIDPNHVTARLEREKALELKKKLPAAKC